MSPRKKKVVSEVNPKGRFLLVWHDLPSTLIIGSNSRDFQDLVIPPYSKVVADELWMGVPHFVADVQSGKLHTERSNTVPLAVTHDVPDKYLEFLKFNQREFVRLVCAAELPLPPQFVENINIHKLIGENGIPKQNSSVTKRYLVEEHRPMLLAISDLEKTWKNRAEVIELIKEAVRSIDSL